MKRRIFLLAFVLSSTACDPAPDVPVVAERFVTAADAAMNIDSVATHDAPGGSSWLFATAKDGNIVRIYDAVTGAQLRDLGGFGTGPGEFRRPNGIVAADGMLIVVERDNRRVQIFSLPALDPVAHFGDEDLIRPYGAWLEPTGSASYRLFVTDNYETANERVPPADALDRRVQVFSLAVLRDETGIVSSVDAVHERAFGATEGPGMLRVVESIWGDPDNDRLLLAEEDPVGGRVIKVYSFDGDYTGPIIGDGVFRNQPEGIALYECADGGGYWVTTDQDPGHNVFHLFDRQSLAYVGGFSGEVTRHTDGIAVMRGGGQPFPEGALYAVHDDQAVAAFDWRDVRAALALPADC